MCAGDRDHRGRKVAGALIEDCDCADRDVGRRAGGRELDDGATSVVQRVGLLGRAAEELQRVVVDRVNVVDLVVDRGAASNHVRDRDLIARDEVVVVDRQRVPGRVGVNDGQCRWDAVEPGVERRRERGVALHQDGHPVVQVVDDVLRQVVAGQVGRTLNVVAGVVLGAEW